MLQVTGDCTGAVSQTLLLVFQVYNDDGEMIGADFSQVLLPDTGREHAFETLIDLPCQEAVSLIAVQVIPDPGTWMMSAPEFERICGRLGKPLGRMGVDG